MDVHDYLIDHTEFDWSELLAPWGWLLPAEFTVWLMNRFGDLFIVLDDGSVHMFDIGQGAINQVAESRDVFCDVVDEDENQSYWLLTGLVDHLLAAGERLEPGQCYGYVQPPVIGGEYSVDNVCAIPIDEYYSMYASFHEQIKDLPDGAQIQLNFTE